LSRSVWRGRPCGPRETTAAGRAGASRGERPARRSRSLPGPPDDASNRMAPSGRATASETPARDDTPRPGPAAQTRLSRRTTPALVPALPPRPADRVAPPHAAAQDATLADRESPRLAGLPAAAAPPAMPRPSTAPP